MSDFTVGSMTTTLGSSVHRQARAALPWPALLVLGGATFTMVTAEMLPTAVLGPMSAGLGVTESATGVLVSMWAAVVVVASLPLVRLLAGRDRRAVIVAAILVLALSAVGTAIAPTYAVAAAARLVGAAAVGLLWATINALVADLVDDDVLGRAVAIVLGGATLGMVLGTPLANLVARATSWRLAFAALAVAAVVFAVTIRVAVPPAPRASARPDPRAPAGRRRPGGAGAMVAVAVLVGVVLAGHYGAYTYVTRLVEHPSAALPGGVSTMLLVFGLSSALGVVLAGRFGRRTAAMLVAAAAVTVVAVAALRIVEVHPAVGTTVVVVWGVATGALPALAQTLVLRLAGPERRATAGALIPVVFNAGIAVGAGLASAVVAQHGVRALPLVAAAIIAAATAALAAATSAHR